MPIFDQGYQHWQGKLTGHTWRWLAVARHGVRRQMKNLWVWAVLLCAWVPAIGLVMVLVFWGLLEQQSEFIAPLVRLFNLPPELRDGARGFRVAAWTIAYQVFFWFEMFFTMILVVLVGPNLISQDLRFNAIPLYLSRPLRRFDYFAGKLAVIAWFLAAVAIVPAVIAYVFGIAFSLDLSVIKDTGHLLLASIGYGVLIALSAGTLMLALSSLSRRSLYVGAMWIGIWWVSGIVSTVFMAIYHEAIRQDIKQREMVTAPVTPQKKFGNPRMDAWQKTQQEIQSADLKATRDDWRPLLSYVGNLQRVGQTLMGTEAAWRKMARLGPPGAEDTILLNADGSQHPWYWSATVLAGLFGLSLWILTFRVKSLDRLR